MGVKCFCIQNLPDGNSYRRILIVFSHLSMLNCLLLSVTSLVSNSSMFFLLLSSLFFQILVFVLSLCEISMKRVMKMKFKYLMRSFFVVKRRKEMDIKGGDCENVSILFVHYVSSSSDKC